MTNQIKSFGANTFAAGTFDPVFIESSASGSFGIACGVALFSVTPPQATFGIKMPAQVATFTETGNAATFARGVSISCTTATFTETGNAAASSRTYRLSATVATFTETGNVASTNRGIVLPIDVASLSETGNPASLAKSYKLVTSTAALSLTGYDASFAKAGISALATGSSTATATVILQLVVDSATDAGTSTAACSRIRSKTGRAGGAGHDVQNAGLAPKKKKKHETKHDYGYIITYSFDGQTDIHAQTVASESVLVTGNGVYESVMTVDAQIRNVPITEVVAAVRRVA